MLNTRSVLDTEARDALAAVVGEQHVVARGAELEAAETATFATTERVRAIVRPASTDEVRECVRVAARLGLTLHPVSAGKSWGLGSRVPPKDGSVLLELSRMRRIVECDEALGFITVEPGVTYQQAYDFLRERRSRHFLSSTGSTPWSSLVGNTIDRGDGGGPLGDHFAHACNLQVVLPSGELIHTGFGRFEGTRVAPLHRWGVGPSLDGLFSQSGLGVVTRMSLWLTPLPRCLTVVRFELIDPARLPPVVDALRTLRMDGTVRAPAGLWNDYRVASARCQFPFDRPGAQTPLARAILAELDPEAARARWHGVTALYAPSVLQARAAAKHVERVLEPLVDRLELDEHSGIAQSGRELGPKGDPALCFMQGIPHRASLASVYWRKRVPVPPEPDPDRDRCGVLWACPTLPLRGSDVHAATELCERICFEHGFEPLLAALAQTDRTAYLVPLLIYDRDAPGDDERARACHDALVAALIAAGYPPHRLGLASRGALPPSSDDTDRVMERLRRSLDPGGVLGGR